MTVTKLKGKNMNKLITIGTTTLKKCDLSGFQVNDKFISIYFNGSCAIEEFKSKKECEEMIEQLTETLNNN